VSAEEARAIMEEAEFTPEESVAAGFGEPEPA
jgi:hypothetical protein